MKLIFTSLVKQPNAEDIKVEAEVDAEYEIYKSPDELETKAYTFKEPDTGISTRVEFTNASLNIFRDAVTLVFKLNKKTYDSSIHNENNQLIPLISVLDEIDFEKNKAAYRLLIQDANDNEILLSNCFIELKVKLN
ncbi:Hypothetical protein MAGb_2140 [Mycoplasmopsis agalactiae 14628]|uniref:Uncharacterized protein n=1 Tax=Mycoplasmopsis agalactiae 14628 TaxID=1110504 RepID=I5D6K6_MYCAA|nr:hypothetical protein [Mycoplasmopsis agalactiae]EIN15315.1 Hypothetical protein MAGb_2140 [Mycoplasmopsis agalactiae 14628]